MKRHIDFEIETDKQLRDSCQINKIITFNGQGCSGKTTQAKRLTEEYKEKNYVYALFHYQRDNFDQKFYSKHLDRKDKRNEEVMGIPSLPWFLADYHWRIKPLLLKDHTIVYDHYLGDYYAEMLPEEWLSPKTFLDYVKDNLNIPDFSNGKHFYLDINWDTYIERATKRKKCKPNWGEPINVKYFHERRERYKKLCELGYLKCIDANRDEEAVYKDIIACKNT